MWELVKAGGIMMFPIILCSIVGMGIIIERLIMLRVSKVAPASLIADVWNSFKAGQINPAKIEEVSESSPLGRILAAGLSSMGKGRDQMKEAIEENASFVIHDLERYLNTLGTIAAIAPLLGLLGTVFGLIEIFTAFLSDGTTNASLLAGGIAMALITTATGLGVAIPAVFFHRFLVRRVDELVVAMEKNVTKLMNAIDEDYATNLKEKEQKALKVEKKENLTKTDLKETNSAKAKLAKAKSSDDVDTTKKEKEPEAVATTEKAINNVALNKTNQLKTEAD